MQRQSHLAVTSEPLPLKTHFALLRAVGVAHPDAVQQEQCVAAGLAAPPCGSCVLADHPHADVPSGYAVPGLLHTGRHIIRLSLCQHSCMCSEEMLLPTEVRAVQKQRVAAAVDHT